MPKLFFQNEKTGERFEILNVKEIEVTYDDESISNEYTKLWNYTNSFEWNIDISHLSVNKIMIAIGLKNCVTNNWLRMHGYTMNRRRKK